MLTGQPGPRTLEVVRYVADHPGCKKADVTGALGVYYNSVQRAIGRGYIHNGDLVGRRYYLYATAAGLRALAEAEARAEATAEEAEVKAQEAQELAWDTGSGPCLLGQIRYLPAGEAPGQPGEDGQEPLS